MAMSTPATNKTTARRVYEEALNQGRLQILDEVPHPDFTNHAAPPDAPDGPAGARAAFEGIRTSAPEYRMRIEHAVAEGDLVVLHCTGFTGPMQGEFLGVDVTGRSTEIPQAHVFRFLDDRIIEHWGIRHELPALRDLGVVAMGPSAQHPG